MKILKIFLAFFIVLLTGCSNLNKNNSKHTSLQSIEGKWIVTDVIFKGNAYNVTPPKGINIYSFFGAEAWKNAEGKHFSFEENNTWNTDIIATEKMINLNTKYNFDKNLYLFCLLNTENQFEFEIKLSSLTEKKMTWDLNSYIEINFTKEKMK
ncbi:hypothetical protein [Flavobacterium sp. UBA7682]|uniref:hypothetical protein n=1 Tax=Flavobacterium sp. UBA7682 TaxID=1946560 RepID=UPI0025BB6B19|nr:hypothetical protein [Flavobacterium sp. UBA7682]